MIRKDLTKFSTSPFNIFDKDYAIVTAGDLKHRNSMTISWGLLGTLFDKPVVAVFIRPTRFTAHLMDESDMFTVSFLDKNKYSKQLEIMGSLSGKDTDKYKASGLTAVYDSDKFISYIKESKYVMKCKKISELQFNDLNLFDKGVIEKYKFKGKDFHKIYLAQITYFLSSEDEN